MATPKLEQYKLADWTDDAVSPIYMGYITEEGNWYIKKIDTATRNIRYAVGLTDYPTNFASRASQTYYYLNEVF